VSVRWCWPASRETCLLCARPCCCMRPWRCMFRMLFLD
jgi:hypothetical protein